MKLFNKFLVLFSFLVLGLVWEKAVPEKDYNSLRQQYLSLQENDRAAFDNGLDAFITKATKEKNYEMMAQGFDDALFFINDKNQKLNYANKAIKTALLSKNKDTIGNAYLRKGIVYYYNFRQFKKALNEYLLAYRYLEDSKNRVLTYQNLYHIAEMKAYLGYNEEALLLFKKCLDFFGNDDKNAESSSKDYLNSLHQTIVCLQKLDRFKEADTYLDKALHLIVKNPSQKLQKSYFFKSKGISELEKGHYKKTQEYFEEALPELILHDDFINISIIHFYQGLLFEKSDRKILALESFKKVDSIFNKHQFVLPEVRPAFEYLLENEQNNMDVKKELYYTKQLLKADENLNGNFQYLSGKIHKEYDKHSLEVQQQLLIQKETRTFYVFLFTVILLGISVIFCIYRLLEHRNSKREYIALNNQLQKMKNELNSIKNSAPDTKPKLHIPDEVTQQILLRLEIFEKEKGFLQKGLTQQKLASQLQTNVNYLSQVINEHKGTHFNKYLGTLRISYITDQLHNNKVFLKYSVETLAQECGIASRQNFSDLFFDINGVRPTDFIRTLKQQYQIV
ncbi:AraC family transcriptional regulator [Chryseobacterium sp. SSA4.19]|uniref:helix-turn-helix domain-containing protein n=1 Tax=Chryseobacterium sp. SSA4.19 TaxID=2919915 RepID=UPI001F4D7DCB|nr:AraC family transcriptional regulator [Chryseobacterium sp. SSA4.19]MCJ8152754.1 AraC family transcriptional regulator [Chryseobacterium sp. SSA4.19]